LFYTINKLVYNYNDQGAEGISIHLRGGNHSSFLSWQEEEDILQQLKKTIGKRNSVNHKKCQSGTGKNTGAFCFQGLPV